MNDQNFNLLFIEIIHWFMTGKLFLKKSHVRLLYIIWDFGIKYALIINCSSKAL